MTKMFYAAVAPDGSIVDVTGDPIEAANTLAEMFPAARIAIQEIDQSPTANPLRARDMPALAFSQTGLPTVSHRAASMSLETAHAKLFPFFTGLSLRGEDVQKYNDVDGMADAWIGQNYKTSKPSQDPGRPAEVMGIALVPAAHARLAAAGEGPYAILWEPGDKDTPARAAELRGQQKKQLARWKTEVPKSLGKKFTLCAGSSQDCRDSCLVFAGQNASERYNTYRKVAQTMALLREPEAFTRMLVEAIEVWMVQLKKECGGTIRPFIRLNILSDVPWELVAPWVFEHFKGSRLQFYDYTKVPGRKPPKNYDLTFSVSGTDANRAWAEEEIAERRRRIAVVFLGHKKVGANWKQIHDRGQKAIDKIPLPRKFWGLPVVDGDVSDVRPYDPAPACVGLRWKTPSGKRAGVDVDPGASAFVTPVYVVDQDSPSKFSPNPSRGSEQWLIAAVTPRYMPIVQPMTQPG